MLYIFRAIISHVFISQVTVVRIRV